MLLLAGCAGAAPAEVAAAPPSASSASPANVASTPTPSAAPTPSPSPTPALAPTGVPPPALAPDPPSPSGFSSDLSDLGLDIHNLPPLAKLDPRALRGVMRLFARSLGVKCADCHDASDASFAAPTRRKKIATRMWNEFLVKLAPASEGGAGLFCDSCHAGRVHFLDRSDKRALAGWMDAHFVQRLARKDGKDHGCETCHVDMDMTFLSAWGR